MPFTGEVIENEKLAEDVHVLKIHFPELENFSYLPGQFAVLAKNGIGRAYSIANYPANGYLEFCVKKVPNGKFSPLLCSLETGERLNLYAPFGDFVISKSIKNNLIFICSGTGIAPIKAMIEFLLHENLQKKKEILLLYTCREKHMPYKNFFENIQKAGVKVFITNDPKSSLEEFPSLSDFEAYVCGSPFFVKEMIEVCKKKKVERVKYEKCIFSSTEDIIKKLCKF